MGEYAASVAWMYLDVLRQLAERFLTTEDVLNDMNVVPSEESVYAAIIREEGLKPYDEAEQEIYFTVMDIIGA